MLQLHGNGILILQSQRSSIILTYFDRRRNEISILKFVPASGAATRMFKFLFEFLKV